HPAAAVVPQRPAGLARLASRKARISPVARNQTTVASRCTAAARFNLCPSAMKWRLMSARAAAALVARFIRAAVNLAAAATAPATLAIRSRAAATFSVNSDLRAADHGAIPVG